MKLLIDNCTLYIKTDEGIDTGSVTFSSRVYLALSISGVVVILLHPNETKGDNRNVFGVDVFGEIIWRALEVPSSGSYSPFINIAEEGSLIALYSWEGTKLLLEPISGHEMERTWQK